MLLTTSRKPSQRTRSFSQKLARAMGWRYVNRGKMSLREVLIESRGPVAVVFERHGNPSRITFLDEKGREQGYVIFSISLSDTSLNLEGTASRVKSCTERLKPLIDLMGLELDPESDNNTWFIKPAEDYMGVMELIDAGGQPAGLKIFVRDFKIGEKT